MGCSQSGGRHVETHHDNLTALGQSVATNELASHANAAAPASEATEGISSYLSGNKTANGGLPQSDRERSSNGTTKPPAERSTNSQANSTNGKAQPRVNGNKYSPDATSGHSAVAPTEASFSVLQSSLYKGHGVPSVPVVCRAAGLKHIGFGPLKKENQDEFYVQIGGFGGREYGHLFAVFDGHGVNGKTAAKYCREVLPVVLEEDLHRYFAKATNESGIQAEIELIISNVFVETERRLKEAATQSGVDLSSSGTTATAVYVDSNRCWVAAVGDSRVVMCSKSQQNWVPQPLTLDHRPSRPSERARVLAAGGRVEPKRLPSGHTVGEPRIWLQHAPSPGLLLSRSLGDNVAASVGCTSTPEVSFVTLRPHQDCFLVLGSDGVWDVLQNAQVCDMVVKAVDPERACMAVLEGALAEWEERMAADNVTVLVAEFLWNEEVNVKENTQVDDGTHLDSIESTLALSVAAESRPGTGGQREDDVKPSPHPDVPPRPLPQERPMTGPDPASTVIDPGSPRIKPDESLNMLPPASGAPPVAQPSDDGWATPHKAGSRLPPMQTAAKYASGKRDELPLPDVATPQLRKPLPMPAKLGQKPKAPMAMESFRASELAAAVVTTQPAQKPSGPSPVGSRMMVQVANGTSTMQKHSNGQEVASKQPSSEAVKGKPVALSARAAGSKPLVNIRPSQQLLTGSQAAAVAR